MLKKIAAMLAAMAMVMGLAACNTVKGVGKDVEKAGEGVQNAADKAQQ
ncbi:MAG: entericidin A/B family lipoprotein [Pseudomonadota bacterium]|nr:entericidin A/B family lipoprotein [Pseudomonadota bacterium]